MHLGIEVAYVITGGGASSVIGQPDRMLKQRDGFEMPPEVAHSVRNGNAVSRLAITYVVEKVQPSMMTADYIYPQLP
jgi:hypothetical protein